MAEIVFGIVLVAGIVVTMNIAQLQRERKFGDLLEEIERHIEKWENFQNDPDLFYNADRLKIAAFRNYARTLKNRLNKYNLYADTLLYFITQGELDYIIQRVDVILETKIDK